MHADNKDQTERDISVIHSLVRSYLANERAIILAVVGANNDPATQMILKYARDYDPKGARTLGIITKPDLMKGDGQRERKYLELVQNKNIKFDLGWHMLKNQEAGEAPDFQKRNAAERAFFSTGNYKSLDPKILGIDNLRSYLSKLLYNHLTRELPVLRKEIEQMLTGATHELNQLGAKRSTTRDQRIYINEISRRGHDIMQEAVRGSYTTEKNFFGKVDTKAEVDSKANLSRLRAVVQHLNRTFAERMRSRGHKFSIKGSDMVDNAEDLLLATDCALADMEGTRPVHLPEERDREEAEGWAIEVLQRTRGMELPGQFKPELINELFQQLSEPWNDLALDHVDRVADVCSSFATKVLSYVAADETRDRLLELCVNKALEDARKACGDELNKIIQDKRRHPMTYDPHFRTAVQRM